MYKHFSHNLTRTDENNSNYRKQDSSNAGLFTKFVIKKNYSHKRKYHGMKKRECDVNNKTNMQVQNVVDKNNLEDTEVSAEILKFNHQQQQKHRVQKSLTLI